MNFLEKKKIKSLNENIFWLNNVSYAMGYKIIKSSNPHTFKNNLTKKKTRDQKKIVTVDQIREIEEIL